MNNRPRQTIGRYSPRARGRSYIDSFTKAGLQLWLKASYGVTEVAGVVSAWTSRLGSGGATQGTSTRRPTLIPNALNGKDVIRGDGIADTMSISGVTYGSEVSIFIVASVALTSEAYIFGSSGVSSAPAFLSKFASKDYEFFGALPRFTFAASATGFNILEFIHKDGDATLGFFNGSEVYNEAATLTISGNMFAEIFSANGTTNFFDGDIAEILVYDRVLSTVERTSLRNDLSNEYAIILP